MLIRCSRAGGGWLGCVAGAAVAVVFVAKTSNRVIAAEILGQVRRDYDESGEWDRLDELASRLDIDDVCETWGEVLAVHPLPLVLNSLHFNLHCDVCNKTITALLYLDG